MQNNVSPNKNQSLRPSRIPTNIESIKQSPALQSELAKLVQCNHCFRLLNGLDQAIESLQQVPKVEAGDGKVRIFYGSGTKTHDADFATIAKPLAQVMRDYANVELVLAGHLDIC